MMKTERAEREREGTSRVLLVEDHPMFREHLAELISRELGLSICGEADNIEDALTIIQRTEPDIAVVDITLQGASGLELIKKCKERGIEVKILVLSMHDEDLYAERALRVGARGYITKNRASSEIIEAVRCVLRGEVYASAHVTSRLLDLVTGTKRELTGIESLADRELEVFTLLGRGKSTREMAEALQLGESTVETYRARIKQKLGLRSAAELYLRAGEWVRERGG